MIHYYSVFSSIIPSNFTITSSYIAEPDIVLPKINMPASNGNRILRRRHKHTMSPDHHPQVSATTPPHHRSQRATAAPSASSYTWQDLRKDPSTKKRATIATIGSESTTTRPVKGGMGYLMTGGTAAGMKMGVSTHHPLFLPQISVPKPKGMRQEANRRNLHHVLLKTG